MQRAPSSLQLIQMHTLNAFIETVCKTKKTKLEEKVSFTPLFGGMSQASLFQFTYEDRPYVMRILPDQASDAERKRQIALMMHASQSGIGPSMFFVSPRMDAVIMQFIDGSTTTPDTFREDRALRDFAQLLQRLHSSQTTAPLASSPFLRFHNFLMDRIISEPAVASKIDAARAIIETIQTALTSHPLPLAPTHLDLHSLNIMQENDQFLLVDWVNGGLSDPFLDLATFTVFQNLDISRTALFLEAYFQRSISRAEWARFHILLPVRPLVIAAAMLHHSQMALNQHPMLLQHPSFDDFLHAQSMRTLDWPAQVVGLIMLNHGVALAHTPIFQESLNYLQK